jgi:hypothetical protein
MMPMHHGTDPGKRKGDPVNALTIMYVNDHLDSLRTEAQQRRSAGLAEHRSTRSRIASATAELRRTLGIDASGPTVPALKNYPYGG